MSRIKLMAVFACLSTFVLSLAYVANFHSALATGDWIDVKGYTRIVIPDTFVYKGLIDGELSLLGITVAGIKNAIGPALIWNLAFSNWFLVATLNSLMLLALLLYVIKLCKHFKVPRFQHIQVRYIAHWSMYGTPCLNMATLKPVGRLR